MPSPSRVASLSKRRAGWVAGVSSVRQVTTRRNGRPRSRRARYANTSSDDASAHCTSSISTTAGRSPWAAAEQGLHQTFDEPRVSARIVERPGRRRAELGHEPCSLRSGAGVDLAGVAFAQSGPQQVEHRSEGQTTLVFEAARRDRNGSMSARPADQFFAEPCLADADLTLDHDEVPVRADRGVRVEKLPPLERAADERMARVLGQGRRGPRLDGSATDPSRIAR